MTDDKPEASAKRIATRSTFIKVIADLEKVLKPIEDDPKMLARVVGWVNQEYTLEGYDDGP